MSLIWPTPAPSVISMVAPLSPTSAVGNRAAVSVSVSLVAASAEPEMVSSLTTLWLMVTALVPSCAKSSNPTISTVCGTFQFSEVNVRTVDEETVFSMLAWSV